ncbi:MAG: 50S ribosomal protein L21 [Hyphomonadaceae bacterium]
MFAVIRTGGKQYKVAQDDEIVIEKLDADAGDDVTFAEVLMLGEGGKVTIGAPLVAGASVVGEIAEQRKGQKVLIYKKRQRSTYRRKKGHRQLETVVKITSILVDGKKAPAKKKAAPKAAEAKPKAEPKAAAKPAAKKAAPKKASSGGDDLTKITGIGKVFAGKLQAEGITSFADLAGLSAARVSELEEKLGVGGKFDDWVSQAKALA